MSTVVSTFSIGTIQQLATSASTSIGDNLANFSVSFWFKNSSGNVDSPLGAMISKLQNTTFAPAGGWGIGQLQPSGTLYIIVQSDSFNYLFLNPPNVVDDNVWHNLVVVKTSFPDLLAYLDGVQVFGSFPSGTLGSFSNAFPVTLGSSGNGAQQYTGLLDDVRIYNVALSPTDASTIFAGNNPSHTTISYWPIEEGSGTTIADISGNSNNITLTSPFFAWSADVPVPPLSPLLPFTFVQYADHTALSSNTSIVTPSSATGSGNLLVVLVTIYNSVNSDIAVTGVTDNAGNVYIQVPGATIVRLIDGFYTVSDVWYKSLSTGGATSVTVTANHSSAQVIGVFREFSGGPASLDSADAGQSSGASVPGINVTDPSVLIIGAVSTPDSVSFTASFFINASAGPGEVSGYRMPGVAGYNSLGNVSFAGPSYIFSTVAFDSSPLPAPTPPWESTGSLNTARAFGSVVKLTTGINAGKLLAVGGYNDAAGVASSACELYDASSKTWSITGSTIDAHGLNPTVLLADGTPLTIGGRDQFTINVNNGCELYDVNAGTWSLTGSMNVARYGSAAILLNNGKVLCGGGYDTGTGLFSWELYDPIAGTWALTGSSNVQRGECNNLFKLPDGTVLIAGGYMMVGYPATCEIYDPVAGTWSFTGSLHTPRYTYGSATLPDGTFLVAGGVNVSTPELTSETFDPVSKTWTVRGSTTNAYSSTPNNLIEDGAGEFFIFGGGTVGNSAEQYNPILHTWSDAGTLGTFKYEGFCAQSSDGSIVIAGGHGGTSGVYTSTSVHGPVGVPLTLSLSDSVSSSDSVTAAFGISFSDSVSILDSTPGSFSVQSDHIVTNNIPVVESLVNQLVPAFVKTYFKIVE